MDRKQAYTIGAIVVVSVVALIVFISTALSGDDGSFAGMNARGYDLAQMPFATDAAEQYLLANAYPDMKENNASLLYTAEEKEQRQAEDAAAAEEENAESSDAEDSDDSSSASSGSNSGRSNSPRGYGGRGGGYGGGSGGGTKTEIGTLSTGGGMASSNASGVSSTYGPSGDFHQFKGREDRGNARPAQLKTDDARRALGQFRQGSLAAARIKENKMRNASKALFGGDVRGSEAFTKDGVDLSKLAEGGLTLDTSAPPTTSDLDDLEDKVADAAQKAEDDKKKEDQDKKEWWEEMLIDLAKNAANILVNGFLSSITDTISTNIQAGRAKRSAENDMIRYGSDVFYAKAASDNDFAKSLGYTDSKDFLAKNPTPDGFFKSTGKTTVMQDPEWVTKVRQAGIDAKNDVYQVGTGTNTPNCTIKPSDCKDPTPNFHQTSTGCWCSK